jgi:hypothetical protein
MRYLFAEGRVRYLFAEGRVRYLFAEGQGYPFNYPFLESNQNSEMHRSHNLT